MPYQGCSFWCRAPFGGPWPHFNYLSLTISFFLLHAGRPLWREDGSIICSAITHWLESHRTHNHILLSHMRLLQPGMPVPRIYIPQEQGGPVIPPGTGFPFRRLLRLAGLRWRCSILPPHGADVRPDTNHTENNLSYSFCNSMCS
jgi:hypothetical protein